MGAAVASAAERAAPSAGVSGNKAACGDQQQLDSVLAGRGEAGVQAGHRPPVRRFPEELGCDALVVPGPPILDDMAGEVPDLRRGQGVRVGDETAGELITQPGRQDGQELRDGVLVAADDERLCPAGLGGLYDQGDGIAVMVAGKLDDAFVDPVGLQAVPPAEAIAAHPLGRRQRRGTDLAVGDTEQPGVAAVDHRDPVGGAALDGQQQRPHVRAGGEHGPLLQLARQRDRLGQAELVAGEDRHRVAEPVAGAGGQQPADSPRVGRPYPDRRRNAGAVADSEREQLADVGRQAAELGGIQRHLHIQRQQRRPCRPQFQ